MQASRVLFSSCFLLIALSARPQETQNPIALFPFVRAEKVGFIDAQGREVISPRFSNAGDTAHFNDGWAPVFEAGKGSGYIDSTGKFVVGPTEEWGWGRPFHEGVAAVLLWTRDGGTNKPAWIDRSGKILFSGAGVEGTYFSEGLMSMPKDGKWGFVDKSFQFVIAPQFDYAFEFSDGRAEVNINHKSGFIDHSGKLVIPAKYNMVWPFQDGLARVRLDFPKGTAMTVEGEETVYRYRYGFVDRTGTEVITPRFEDATYFSEGYAMAAPADTNKFGVIDKNGNFVALPKFDSGNEFSDGLAFACVKQRCGYISPLGVWVIPPVLSYGDKFSNGLARVTWKAGDYGYIDKTGTVVWRSTVTSVK